MGDNTSCGGILNNLNYGNYFITHSDNDYSIQHGDGCIYQQFSRDERGATIAKV